MSSAADKLKARIAARLLKGPVEPKAPKAPKAPKVAPAPNPKEASVPKRSTSGGNKVPLGARRDHSAPPQVRPAPTPRPQAKAEGKRKRPQVQNKAASTVDTARMDPRLVKEVLELGGDADDLKILQTDDAEEEGEEGEQAQELGEAALDEKKLMADVGGFLKSLGLASAASAAAVVEDDYEDVNEDDEDDDEDEDEDEEDEEEEEEEEEEEDYEEEAPALVPATKAIPVQASGMVITPSPMWHTIPLPDLSPIPVAAPSPIEVERLQARAQSLFVDEIARYEEKGSTLNRGDKSFFKSLMTSGTLNDKVSALTLLVQESPIHTSRTMDTLLTMSRKRHRKEAILTIGSLKDLLTNTILPDRKLRFFQDNPILHPDVTDAHYILWAYEDTLKRQYLTLIQTMEALTHDPLPHIRQSMVGHVYELLVAKPEQEHNLLALLVNKLGDLDRKVASRATYLVQTLLVKHPNMKLVITSAVQEHLFRKGMALRAQYYGILALNQIILTSAPADLLAANRLVDVYFALFRKILLQRKERPAILAASASGLFSSTRDARGEKVSKKVRRKVEEAERAAEVEAELESRIVAAVLTGINRAFPFAKLSPDAYDEHVDTLFRVVHTGTFNVVIQALRLLFQVSSAQQGASDRYYRVLYDAILDPRLVHSSKQALFLNLLYKSLKADDVLHRSQSFVKRLLQAAFYHQTPFVCGTLYLASELLQAKPGLSALLSQPEEEDDEEERYVDAPEVDEEGSAPSSPKATVADASAAQEARRRKDAYDGLKRDPRYANAGKSCLWELNNLAASFHPSVARLAEILLAGERITELPQLQIHTLTHFLDKFVYRNPKKASASASKGSSIMQPQADAAHLQNVGGGIIWKRGGGLTGTASTRDAAFLHKPIENVSADEVFFHKYLVGKKALGKKDKKGAAAKERDADADSDVDLDAALLGEEEILNAGSDDDEEEEDDFEGDIQEVGESTTRHDSDNESLDEDEIWSAMQSSMKGFEDMAGADDLSDEGLSDDDDEAFIQGMEEDEEEEDPEEDPEEPAQGNNDDDWEGQMEFGMDDEEDILPSGGESEVEAEEEETLKSHPRKKRKKVVLPTFASFEDYEALINKEDGGLSE